MIENLKELRKEIDLKLGYTKENIINKAIETKNNYGFYLNTDNILSDFNGKYMAEYLEGLGFEIVKYYDTGKNGLVITKEGIKVSTNGHVSLIEG